jgi:hypothetical protein
LGDATQGGAEFVSLALGYYLAAPLALRHQRQSAFIPSSSDYGGTSSGLASPGSSFHRLPSVKKRTAAAKSQSAIFCDAPRGLPKLL